MVLSKIGDGWYTIHYNTIKCSSAQSTKLWPTVHYNVGEYMRWHLWRKCTAKEMWLECTSESWI